MDHLKQPASRRVLIPIIVGLCLSAMALASCSEENLVRREVTVQYQVFTEEPQDRDIPPVEFSTPPLDDLEDHYFRAVGSHGTAHFYSALINQHDESADDYLLQGLCLVAVDETREFADHQCLEGHEFVNDPVVSVHTVTDHDDDVEAFLVPDEAEFEMTPGWVSASRNIIIVNDAETAASELNGQMWDNEEFRELTLVRGTQS